jgi:hypothetical protein
LLSHNSVSASENIKFHCQLRFQICTGLSLRRLSKNGRHVHKTTFQRRLLWHWEAAETLCIRLTHTGNKINGPEKARSVEMNRQCEGCNRHTALLKQWLCNVSVSNMAKITSSSSSCSCFIYWLLACSPHYLYFRSSDA